MTVAQTSYLMRRNAAIKHYELFEEPELKAQLTAATQRNAELEQEVKGLREALDFISSISHPVRDPLKVVGGDAGAADREFERIRVTAHAALTRAQPAQKEKT